MNDNKTINLLIGLVFLIGTAGLVGHFKLKHDFTESYEKLYKEKVSVEQKCEPYLEYKKVKVQADISRNYTNMLEIIKQDRKEQFFDELQK